MTKFIDLFEAVPEIGLAEASYSLKSFSSDMGGKVRSKDDIRVTTVDDNALVLIVERKLEFDVNVELEIKCQYYIKYKKKSKYANISLYDEYDIKKEVEQNLSIFFIDCMDTVSLAISNLTSAFGSRPIISLPEIQKSELEKDI